MWASNSLSKTGVLSWAIHDLVCWICGLPTWILLLQHKRGVAWPHLEEQKGLRRCYEGDSKCIWEGSKENNKILYFLRFKTVLVGIHSSDNEYEESSKSRESKQGFYNTEKNVNSTVVDEELVSLHSTSVMALPDRCPEPDSWTALKWQRKPSSLPRKLGQRGRPRSDDCWRSCRS